MDARFFYKELICFIRWSLLLNIFLDGAEISQILNLECLDVCALTENILLGHANVYVSTLLEEFRSLAGITDDEQTHYQLGSHVV